MKYVSFDTWWGGFNNIRQSIELIAGISYMTGRKIILPPKIYIDHLCDHSDKSTFFDIWDVYDKNSFISQFDCVDYEDVDAYQKYNTDQQYFDGICKDINCISLDPRNWGVGDSLVSCMITNTDVNTSKEIIDLRVDDQYIHFPRNLFGFFYEVLNVDDGFKHKLRKGLKINNHIDDLANEFISGDYNAIHVRLGDFSNTRKEQTQTLRNGLYDLIKQNFNNDKPLFIATDERSFDGFKRIEEEYDVRFLSNDSKYMSMILDIVICSNADEFLGTKHSTYTDYIHILRHYKNKKDFSKKGINYSYEGIENKKENYNWHTLFVEMY
jgi:hypothetical protein